MHLLWKLLGAPYKFYRKMLNICYQWREGRPSRHFFFMSPTNPFEFHKANLAISGNRKGRLSYVEPVGVTGYAPIKKYINFFGCAQKKIVLLVYLSATVIIV